MEAVINYYSNYDESSRLTTDNSRKLEFITTTHILDQYISNGSNILDLGAGTGIYSFYYAEKGNDNTIISTDITPKHVEIIQGKIDQCGYGNVTAKVNDARDLSDFDNDSFDVVLCLGPIYHLTDKRDQERCVQECFRVLNPNGILAVAYVNRFFIYPYLVGNDRTFLNEKWRKRIIDQGTIDSQDEECFWTDAYYHTPSEIEELFEGYDVVKLEHIATDGIGLYMRGMINSLDEEEFKEWVAYHLSTCAEPSIIGMSNHGLYLCQKQG